MTCENRYCELKANNQIDIETLTKQIILLQRELRNRMCYINWIYIYIY